MGGHTKSNNNYETKLTNNDSHKESGPIEENFLREEEIENFLNEYKPKSVTDEEVDNLINCVFEPKEEKEKRGKFEKIKLKINQMAGAAINNWKNIEKIIDNIEENFTNNCKLDTPDFVSSSAITSFKNPSSSNSSSEIFTNSDEDNYDEIDSLYSNGNDDDDEITQNSSTAPSDNEDNEQKYSSIAINKNNSALPVNFRYLKEKCTFYKGTLIPLYKKIKEEKSIEEIQKLFLQIGSSWNNLKKDFAEEAKEYRESNELNEEEINLEVFTKNLKEEQEKSKNPSDNKEEIKLDRSAVNTLINLDEKNVLFIVKYILAPLLFPLMFLLKGDAGYLLNPNLSSTEKKEKLANSFENTCCLFSPPTELAKKGRILFDLFNKEDVSVKNLNEIKLN